MAVLTDGREWHFYLPAGEGDYSERRVHRLDLIDDEISVIEARLVRYLHYDAVRSGEAIEAAQSDYRDLAERRQIRTTLPEAWGKLVESEDDLLIELLAEKVKELCGIKPDPDTTAAFLRNQIQLSSGDLTGARSVPSPPKSRQTVGSNQTIQQSSQTITYTLYGRVHDAKSGADLMVRVFNNLADRDPGFLERFAALPKSPRQKRPYLAKRKEALYPGSPHLMGNAHKLRLGWWLDTHMGNPHKLKVIKKACEVAGIEYGRDMVINKSSGF